MVEPAWARAVNVHELEVLAEHAVEAPAWAYVAGGSGDEHTLRWNPAAWAAIRLAPRCLVDVSRLDLLKMTAHDREIRYAHSYIGLGITPTVALELEKGGKGSIREIISTIRTFSKFRPFQIRTDSGTESFDSVIFANIREMAKVAVLSEGGRPDDGRFEVIVLRHTAKWRVLATAVRAAIRGLGPQPSAREYRFTTVDPMPVQVDGEVSEFERGVSVTVEIVPSALKTVL